MISILLAQTAPVVHGALEQWVMQWKIHPVLVNFTAALVPVSVACDLAARAIDRYRASLRIVGWWTILFAAAITPFTAMAGWLFWMPDDNGVSGMAIHKWLGTTLAVVILGMMGWRAVPQIKARPVSWIYLAAALLVVATLIYQGSLGGNQVFQGM